MQVAKRHMPEILFGIGATGGETSRKRLPFALLPVILIASLLAYFLLSPGDFQAETISRRTESTSVSRRAEEPVMTAARPAGEVIPIEERFDVEAVMLQLLRKNPSRHFEDEKLQALLLFMVCLAALLAGLFSRDVARRFPAVLFHFQCILKGSSPVRAGPASIMY